MLRLCDAFHIKRAKVNDWFCFDFRSSNIAVSKTNGHHIKSTSDDVVDITDEDDLYNEDASMDDRDDHDDR